MLVRTFLFVTYGSLNKQDKHVACANLFLFFFTIGKTIKQSDKDFLFDEKFFLCPLFWTHFAENAYIYRFTSML